MLGGALGNEMFRSGYSATFGVIIALVMNAILLLILDSLSSFMFGRRYASSPLGLFLYLGVYIAIVSLYANNMMDNLKVNRMRF